MIELYLKVSGVTKKTLYPFIKNKNISLLNYNFNSFFHHYVDKNKIKVIGHHFTNKKIEGLTIVDELGVTFSYERENSAPKQNFTLCHELGHYILKHNGNYFMESVDNQEDIIEREANIFSAVLLMPDIVLLSKIYYGCDSFQKVRKSLEVSKQALYFRLLDLLRTNLPNKEREIKYSIKDYIDGQNESILLFFHEIKEQIITEYNQYKPSLSKQINNNIALSGFITSNDIPELLNQNNWQQITEENSNLKVWLVYNKGKSLAYVWDKDRISDKQARKKAELELLIHN